MQEKALDEEARYRLIKLIAANPDISQRELAKELGVSLGKVNYLLKALADVGWIKAGNFARSNNKAGYAYVLTPKGMAEKINVTKRFLLAKQAQYLRLQKEIEALKNEVGK
jgi:EPS-associated MarR family transcriptional regulator